MKIEYKPDSIAPVTCTQNTFIQAWLRFMEPYHGLSKREREVAAAFIEKYLELCKKIPNDKDFRNKCLMSLETQKEICDKCNIKHNQIQLYRNKFKKNNVIINGNELNPKLVPNMNNMQGNKYQLLVLFDIKDDEIPIDNTESSVEE